MKKWLSLFMVITLCTGVLSGCGNSSSNSPQSQRTIRSQNQELVVAIGSEPEAGFDSTTGGHGSITKLFFSTLFKRDKTLGWTNDLATGYSVSEDGLTWTVTIREDVKFTDGSALTANDVAYTYETAKNAGSEVDLTIIDTITVLDDYRVAFKLKRVYSPFMERLAYLGIVPKSAHGEDFKENPIGSGPYKFVQWDKGQQVIAVVNENYYGEKPKIKKLTLVFLSMDTAFEAVKRGDVDVAQINGAMAKADVEGLSVQNIASIECYGVCFPMVANKGLKAEDGAVMGNNVTSDISIRQALNVAVDRQKIVDGIMNGFGSISTTGLEKMPWLNEDEMLNSGEQGNIEKAKQLLKDGGWQDADQDGIIEKNGTQATFKLLYTEGIYRQEMALEFARVAKEIGILIEPEKTTWDTILPNIHQEAVLYGFGSGDPSELYNLYYGQNAGGIIPWDNSGCYDRAEVNQLIDQALGAKDETEAIPFWKALQAYTSGKKDAPYAWLANANHIYMSADNFSFGEPVVQPHGGRIFDNVTEWHWK